MPKTALPVPVAVSVALALVLGACAANQPRTMGDVSASYDYGNFTKYHWHRDTLVEVHGSPFGLPPAEFGSIVTQHMQDRYSGVDTNFTTSPGPSAEKGFRVVMLFNARPEGDGICTARQFTPTREEGPLQLTAAWCWDKRADSEVRGWVSGVNGPDDPAFRALVAQATAELFPPFRDEREDFGTKKPED